MFLVVASIVVSYLYSDTWATKQQKSYVENSKKMYGDSSQWEGKWIHTIFKIGFVFVAIVIIAIAFSFLFGPIYL